MICDEIRDLLLGMQDAQYKAFQIIVITFYYSVAVVVTLS